MTVSELITRLQECDKLDAKVHFINHPRFTIEATEDNSSPIIDVFFDEANGPVFVEGFRLEAI